ncbi:Inner centromere protein A [Frankliniella fusca]|uniref:Inner centromere protein A n=1 Tax=Frankliniella fusca TaxID=407009 RepID=A0AAE1HSV7_9NEOP|nr:Inner centromere protein A [Frankliniella fusca]
MAKTRSLVNGAPEPGKVSSKVVYATMHFLELKCAHIIFFYARVTSAFAANLDYLVHPSQQDEDTASETVLTQLVHSSNRTRETPLSSNFNRLKPIASTSRIPVPILKATFPSDNCIGPLTPSFQRSNSFTVSKSFNLITASRAVHQPINKEDSKTNFKSKIEAAIKKKEEIMNAQMEEKKRMREAKWLKVRAQREAKERGNLEKLIKKEARQKQIQAEREEKIREDNLKKKLLAEKKAAEFEERRRQEKAKLAKIKQQLEEEAEQTADLSQLDQEYAQRKLKGMAQEIEAAAYRVKETEIHSKQASSKSQADLTFTSEPQKNHQTKTNANNHCIADDGPDDSSDEEKPKKPVPLWAQTSHRLPKLLEDQYITQFQVYLFFGSGKTTPDLCKIFSEIDRRMLLRKSSAVWCTPPKVKG